MCDPVSMSIAAFGLTAGTTVMQHQAGVRAAEKQGEALVKADALRQSDLERQLNQQQAQGAEEMNAAHRAALSDNATLDALAGEYGGGATVDRARAVGGLQQGETLATISANSRNGLAETGYTSISSRQNTLSQLRAIQAPSQVGTALAIASNGVNAYGQVQNFNKQNDRAAKVK